MMPTAAQLAEADRLWAEHFAGRTRDQMNDALNDLLNGITEPTVIAILLTRAAEASVTTPDYGPVQMAGLGWQPYRPPRATRNSQRPPCSRCHRRQPMWQRDDERICDRCLNEPWCPRCGYTTRPPIGEHLVRCPDENDVRALYGDA